MEKKEESLFDVSKLSKSSLRKYKVNLLTKNQINFKAFLLTRC